MLAFPEHTIRNHSARGMCLPKLRENVRSVLPLARLGQGPLLLLQLGDLLHAQTTGKTFDSGPILVPARPFIGMPQRRLFTASSNKRRLLGVPGLAVWVAVPELPFFLVRRLMMFVCLAFPLLRSLVVYLCVCPKP